MKMPPIRLDGDAFGDPRFARLAKLLGMPDGDGHFALIKVALIWAWQTEHYSPDEPCFVVPADVIEMALGDAGPAAMVRAKLADETPSGYRIRGATHERIGWLYRSRERGTKGGVGKAVRAKNSEQAYKSLLEAESKHTQGREQATPLISSLSVSQKERELPSAVAPAEIPDPEPRPKPAPETVMPSPEPSGSGSPEAQAKPGPRPAKPPPHPGHQQVIDAFWRGFEAHCGVKPTYTAEVGAHVKRLLASHGTDEVLRRIGNFFSRPTGQWPEERDFGTFVRFFDKWAIGSVPMNVPMPRRSKPL